MLAGQPPFTGPTAAAVLARHALDVVPRLGIVRGTVPPAIEAAITRAMAKVPADRFRSVEDFAAALVTTSADVGRAPRSRRALFVGAGVVGTIVAAWLGWFMLDGVRAGKAPLGEFAKSSMAVMYFDDRSRDSSLRYLADGITEGLIRFHNSR
jgi:serine/threonine-protein kinase